MTARTPTRMTAGVAALALSLGLAVAGPGGARAQALGIEVLQFGSLKDDGTVRRLEALQADLFAVVAFSRTHLSQSHHHVFIKFRKFRCSQKIFQRGLDIPEKLVSHTAIFEKFRRRITLLQLIVKKL